VEGGNILNKPTFHPTSTRNREKRKKKFFRWGGDALVRGEARGKKGLGQKPTRGKEMKKITLNGFPKKAV